MGTKPQSPVTATATEKAQAACLWTVFLICWRISVVNGPGRNRSNRPAEGSPLWDRMSPWGVSPHVASCCLPADCPGPRYLGNIRLPYMWYCKLTASKIDRLTSASDLSILPPAGCPRVRRLPYWTTHRPLSNDISAGFHPGPLGWWWCGVRAWICITSTVPTATVSVSVTVTAPVSVSATAHGHSPRLSQLCVIMH